MRPKEKLFFMKNDVANGCYPLNHFLEISKRDKFDFEIVGARIVYGTEYFYCAVDHEVGLKEDSECGRYCGDYQPRNGKSGRCRYSKNCYETTDNIYEIKNGKCFPKGD